MKPFKINFYRIIAHIVMLGFQICFWNFTIDDAFISFRYAKNFIENGQIVFNVNKTPVEGYSNFLWVIWLSLGFLMNLDPIVFSKVSGIIFCHLCIYVVYKLARLMNKSKNSSAIISIFYALLPNIALWSIGGLETSLFSLFLMIGIYFFINNLKNKKKYSPLLSSLFFTLASLTRHEGIIIYLFTILFLIGLKIKERVIFKFQTLTEILFICSSLIIFYLPYFIWRIYYYGAILPHTFIAKQANVNFLSFLEQIIFYLPQIIVLLQLVLLITLRIHKWRDILRLDIIKIYLLYVAFIMVSLIMLISSWMPGYRFAVPLIPLILLLTPTSLNFFEKLAKTYDKDLILLRYGRIFTILVICVSNLLLGFSFNSYVYRYGIGINQCNIVLGKWIYNNTNESASLAIWDVGAIPFYADIRTIDIFPNSLQDEHLFYNPEDIDHLMAQNISLFILNDEYFDYIKTDIRFITNYHLIFYAQAFYIEDELALDYIYQVYLFDGYYISNSSINDLIKSSTRFYI